MVHGSRIGSASVLAYVICLVAGAGGWLYLGASTSGREGWDNPRYFTTLWPTLMVVAFVLGFAVKGRPWRWGVVLLGAQALIAFVQKPTAGLLPLGLILFAVLAIPVVGLSFLGALLRSALAKRRAAKRGGA